MLTNHYNNIRNVRASHSKMNNFPTSRRYRPISINKEPCSPSFNSRVHRSINRSSTQEISLRQKIKNIFSLRDKEIPRETSNFNPKKITKNTQVFGMKLLSQIDFQISNTYRVASRDNNVVHINNQNNGASRGVMNKDQMIRTRALEPIPKYHNTESIKPGTRRLLKTIQGLS
jgi:hypothetical protein